MSKLEKAKEKAKSLEARDPKAAIEAWLEALKAQEEEADANPDLSIFNRIGDLYLKFKDPAQAADYYDRAVDRYAELGFHNNAIAMCNKVLRNAPARQTTYLKLAKLYAAKGFMAEAKQNFVEYAERMQKIGKIQHAFAALKEFTDISPESAHLRGMLEEHLNMYGDPERHPSVRATPGPATKPEHKDDLSKSGKRKTSSLVFLDVDAPAVPKGKPGVKAAPRTPPPPPTPRPHEPEPVGQSLIEPVTAEPDSSLEIESTNLGEGLEPTNVSDMLEGFETTSAEFGSLQLEGGAGGGGSMCRRSARRSRPTTSSRWRNWIRRCRRKPIRLSPRWSWSRCSSMRLKSSITRRPARPPRPPRDPRSPAASRRRRRSRAGRGSASPRWAARRRRRPVHR